MRLSVLRWSCGIGLLLAIGWLAGADRSVCPTVAWAQDDASPKHLAKAIQLLKDVLPENTSYRHKNNVVTWRDIDGAKLSECHADCSGFLNVLLVKSYGVNQEYWQQWLGAKRPVARHYYQAIAAEKGFKKINSIQDVRPGDIIAIRYEEDANNTGHVMLVEKSPKPHKASEPLIAETQQWEVGVLDESTSGHGKNDSRRRPDGTYHGGLGRGSVRLYTNSSGAIVGYSWSTLAKSMYYPEKDRPLAVGRWQQK